MKKDGVVRGMGGINGKKNWFGKEMTWKTQGWLEKCY
jgi:hypothetical protein